MRVRTLLGLLLAAAASVRAEPVREAATWPELRWASTPAWAMPRPTAPYLKARLGWILAGLKGERLWDEAALISKPFPCDPKTPLAEVAARYTAGPGPDPDALIPAVECLAHETGQWSLCELLRRDPGYAVGAAICGTDLYGREYLRASAAGRPDRRLCKAYVASLFDGMDHLGRDLPGRVDAAGWDRLCAALETDMKAGSLTLCKEMSFEINKIVSSSEAVHLEMEFLRNVCQPDLGAFTQGEASCVATSNTFDLAQCRTNARTAAVLRSGKPELCGSDDLCLAAVGKGGCSGRIAAALSEHCPKRSGPGKPPNPPGAEGAARAFRQEIALLSEAVANLAPDAELEALLAKTRAAASAKGISRPASVPERRP